MIAHGPSELTLLDIIWEQRQISRADLARTTWLSRSTVSSAVTRLLDTGVISERGAGSSRGGRRPILLGFNDEPLSLVGVDLGASHVGVAVSTLRGEILSWIDRTHPVRSDPEGTLRLVHVLIEEALREAGRKAEEVVGIGVAAPTPVAPDGSFSPVVMPAWNGIIPSLNIGERWQVPVFIDNDANVAAVAEHWWGLERKVSDFLYVKVATGVGCGLILDGEIYRGRHGVAGEISHTVVIPHGPPCICGRRGCLATLVGEQSLVDRARTQYRMSPELGDKYNDIDLDDLVEAAEAGDAIAQESFNYLGEILGDTLLDLVNILNPELVVFGGSLTRVGDVFLEPVRRGLSKQRAWTGAPPVDIRQSALGRHVAVKGAITLVLKEALAKPSLFAMANKRAA